MKLLVTILLAAALVAAETPELVPGFPDDDDLAGAIQLFQDWFSLHYGSPPAPVRLGPAGDGMRMGVFATAAIRPERAYLAVPLKIVIDERTIFADSTVGPVFRRLHSANLGHLSVAKNQIALALFLIHQRFIARNTSFWYPYIRLLPTSHDVPMFYTDDDLHKLRGTLIPDKVHQMRQRHVSDFDTLTRSSAFRSESSTFPRHTFTIEHYRWAVGILNTRMIWWDGEPHLVPMLDMINCREGPSNPTRIHSTFRIGDKAITKAPWAFSADEQVFENYGQPNPTYFLYHGFVMEPNAADCASLRLDLARIGVIQRQKLQQFGLWRDEFCVKSAKNEDLVQFARVATASDEAARLMRTVPRHRGPLVSERSALDFVREALEAQLLQQPKPTSNIINTFRGEMINKFISSQRQLLEEAVKRLKKIAQKYHGVDNPVIVGREEL